MGHLLEAAKAGQIEKIQGMLDKGLFCAGKSGNTEMVELMLDWGANINAENDDEETLLKKAFDNHETKLVKILLQHGADTSIPVYCHGNLSTPLHMAVFAAAGDEISMDIVRLLLQSGTDLHDLDSGGTSPIHIAAENGKTDIVKLLLNHGTNVNVHAWGRWTPLHFAAIQGHVGTIQCLLDRGADIDPILNDRYRETPLHLAAEKGHTETVELLLGRGAKIDATDAKRRTPLFSAAFQGHVETVCSLLDRGADIHVADYRGETPLHIAAWRGKTETVQCLLERGANINAADANGKTPFHSAAAGGGHIELSRLMLGHGANINAVDNSGQTALHCAAASKTSAKSNTAEFLLDQGGINTVNVTDRQGNTPLLAVEKAAFGSEIVKLLLDRGAEANAQNKEGKTFLHKLAALGSFGVSGGGWRVFHDEPQILALLINRGVDPNLIDSDGKTPIHIAAERGKLDLIRSLFDGKVPINVEALDAQNLSPLFYASTSGNHDLVHFLLQKGHHAMVHVTESPASSPTESNMVDSSTVDGEEGGGKRRRID